VPEAPRVMTPGRALAEGMEACGAPLVSVADLDLQPAFPAAPAPATIESAAVGAVTVIRVTPTAKPAAPPRFDPEALIGCARRSRPPCSA
jgi:hypothetical protein